MLGEELGLGMGHVVSGIIFLSVFLLLSVSLAEVRCMVFAVVGIRLWLHIMWGGEVESGIGTA